MTTTYKAELDEAQANYYGNVFKTGTFTDFKAGASWERERTKVLVEVIQNYLEIQDFISKPHIDNSEAASDFRKALSTYQGAEK